MIPICGVLSKFYMKTHKNVFEIVFNFSSIKIYEKLCQFFITWLNKNFNLENYTSDGER